MTSFIIYSAFVYTSGTEATHVPLISEEARRGQQVFQQYNCIACHQFYGLGGYMGPDLTNVISNRGDVYTSVFIANGTTLMPNLGLTDQETSDVVAYLGFVDQTGKYPPENFKATWFGVVYLEDDPQ